MKDLAQQLASLSPEERRLLELKLREKGIEVSKAQILPRSEHRENYPLSFTQKRMWFLHQLDPESSAYHVTTPLRARGKLALPALARALARLVERHEVLRTTFSAVDGEPVQIVHEPSPRRPALIDLGRLEGAEREREAARAASRWVRRPFDLERGPLWRIGLLRLGEDVHAFLPVMHHLISDGWSMGIFFRELLALYTAFQEGRPSPLEPLAVQYVDFALWQRGYLDGEVEEKLLAYWKEQLDGIPTSLELPTDHPRPRVPNHRAGGVSLVVPRALVEATRETCRRRGQTLFVALLATYQALLWRFSGQEDVVVGAPSAGRNRQETEGLIGFFVNTLVLRGDLSGDPSFGEILERTRGVNAGANAHQDLPFERLVDELQPDRTLHRMPIYQVAFTFQAEPGSGLEVPGLEIGEQAASNPVILTDLAIALTDSPLGLRGHLLYSAELFDDTTGRRLGERFARLLAGALEDLDRPLSRLSLLTPAERHQLAVEWNGREQAEAGLPVARNVHKGVRDRIAEAPERVALVFEGAGGPAAVTYGELGRRAGSLARRLRGSGVTSGAIVGVCLERGPDVVISLLAVLEAGAAFLPLDPSLPAERLAFFAGDAGAALVIADEGWRDKLGAPVLDPTAVEDVTDAPAELPVVHALQAAYVIYTSGSTGRPKGVVVSHHALLNRIVDVAVPELGPDTVSLYKTSLGFDVSVAEIFNSLLTAGRLVVARAGGEQDPAYLTALIARARIDYFGFSPQMFDLLLDHPGSADWKHVTHVASGGETVPPELAERIHRRFDVRLDNRYGPTETTISVTLWTYPRAGRAPARSPIGRPFPRALAYVVDRGLHRVPVGVHGELCFGGDYLARGYLGRPRRTARSFVPDPFASRPGSRLYRTGDLSRWRGDGALDFLGRVDHQVKIRGFRIELGEIEAALVRQPGVREAAVIDVQRVGARSLAAYVVPRSGSGVGEGELRAALRRELPEYMVPSAWVTLDELPRLTSGKVDRKRLPEPGQGPGEGDLPVAPRNAVEERLAEIWREVLELDWVGAEDNFFDLGGHSLLLIKVQGELEARFERRVAIVDLFRYPTIAALAEFLEPRQEKHVEAERGRHRAEIRRGAGEGASDVAIVGMTCRFPGAANVDEFWRNLRDGVETIRFYTPEELAAAGVDPDQAAARNFVPAHGALDGVELFDAPLFGFSPRDAQITDPQQRLFLECAWEVLEQAGVDPESYGGAIGVFGGVGPSLHWAQLLMSPLGQILGELRLALANEKDFLPTLTSYKLDLKGPSINVQTACSTSLVALHLACQSVLHGECEMALAGGVSAAAGRPPGYFYEEGGVSSPDGHTRTFDAGALGTVGGYGVGVVAVKRLAAALADGDPVRAVIKGSAINNDGSFKVGFTAPSVSGQAQVIAEAQSIAGVEPASVGYVEAHGTATPLGDPIEVSALKEVFGSEAGRRCALGSVKTNFGHLNTAAGVAGLIKTVLALEHRQIPPSLNFESPNPEIDFEASPFYVNTELAPWPGESSTLRAGVSSFGLGGTNAHVVVEEAPERPASGPSRPWQLLVQSARTVTALDALSESLAAHLEAGERDAAHLADVAHTLRMGRRRLSERQAVVCRDASDAVAALRDPLRRLRGSEERKTRAVAFLLPGLGDHYVGMGRELYEGEPAFRREVDRCAEILLPILGEDLREVLYPGDGEGSNAEIPRDDGASGLDLRRLLGRDGTDQVEAASPLDRTRLAQPAVFVVEWALATLWREWGLEPEALIGYSLGEYTAACLAGVFSLEDALALVADRARWIDELAEGVMLAVPLPADEVEGVLEDRLDVAAHNGPAVTVVAGPEDRVAVLEERLGERGVASRRLRSTHAFHSRMMAPLAGSLAERVRSIELHPPRIPYLSNVTGTWIRESEALDPEYWGRHLCEPVRFAGGVEELLGGGAERVLLEVGPGQALSTSVRQHPACVAGQPVYGSLRDARDRQPDQAFLLTTAGKLWIDGVRLDWRGFARHEKRRKVVLPTYPFERTSFALEPRAPSWVARGKRPDLADWFYAPAFKLRPPAPAVAPVSGDEARTWLVFLDETGLAAKVGARLAAAGHEIVTVRAGQGFARLDDGSYRIDRARRDDYRELVEDLESRGLQPHRIAHFWGVTRAPALEEDAFESLQEAGLYSLFHLVQALLAGGTRWPVTLTLVSNGVLPADGREELEPGKATVLGAMRVISQEYPEIPCRSVDVELPDPGTWQEKELVEQVAGELAAGSPELAVAHRRGGRYIQKFEAVKVPADVAAMPRFRRHGVYLITGGLGRIGLRIAAHLAREYQARLVLTGRTPFPERDAWAEAVPGTSIERKITVLRALEEAGAEILVLEADVADRDAMAGVVRQARERFGGLHGVVHLAGTIDEGVRTPVEDVDREVCRQQFLPKVQGLYVLEEVLGDEELDFCTIFSSLATVLGGLGFGAYAAANAFMDAFAHRHNRQHRVPWVAGGWDGWPASLLDLEMSASDEARELAAREGAMEPEEAIETFRRLLVLRGVPQVVVSTADLPARIDEWLRSGTLDAGEDAGGPEAPRGTRPALKTPFVEPSGEREEQIAAVWEEVLGIEGIGARDNFFELGGDSLLATQVASRLRRVLQVELPLRTFFDAPTVTDLAREAGGEDSLLDGLSEIEDVLARIDALSEDELDEALAGHTEDEEGEDDAEEEAAGAGAGSLS